MGVPAKLLVSKSQVLGNMSAVMRSQAVWKDEEAAFVIVSSSHTVTTEIVKRYLYNISKDAMHYMYRGNMISGRVESFNYQLTDLNAIAQLTTMINRKDEELLKIIDNKYRQVEAEIEYMQSKPNTSYANQGIIGKLLFNDESSLVEIKL